MQRFTKLALAITPLAFVALSGCAAQSAPSDAGTETPRQAPTGHFAQLQGNWELLVLRGQYIRPRLQEVGVREMPSLTVDETGRIGGFSGVNRWSSSISIDQVQNGHFKPTQPVSTLMAGHETAMQIENMFYDALSRAALFDTTQTAAGILVITKDDGEELMRFTRSR
jgi:heat shock protein HslJ